ncbi:MAG: hypothetical protein ACM3SV_04720 [Betaproteobacteria bacterium]
MPAQDKSKDRRLFDWGPPEGCPDRRMVSEQRTISVTEISLQEWETARTLMTASKSNPLGLNLPNCDNPR